VSGLVIHSDTPFEGLPLFAYERIIIDVPWSYENWSAKGEHKNARAKYKCMPDKDVLRLPVGHLAAPGCALFVWATWPRLDFAFRCLVAWGFAYVTGGSWRKTTSRGNTAFNTGYVLRNACDPFLIAVVGRPGWDKAACSRTRNLIEARQRDHSRKPDDAHTMLEAMLPGTRGVELFAREPRAAWDVWGNEATKFDTSAGARGPQAGGNGAAPTPGDATAIPANQARSGPPPAPSPDS
jgi:N6-adenosine-specific RNA methylase IME4